MVLAKSRTVQFGTALMAGLTALLQNKEAILTALGNPTWGVIAFNIVNAVIVIGGVFGLSKFRKDGDRKPLIQNRPNPFIFGG